jgi:peptide/nickel transport system substrate-binding protein
VLFNAPGVFSDARLRRAVAFALRREEFVQGVFYDRGAPLAGVPRPKESPYYDEALANYWRYDPDYAKSLMKEAGVPNGFKAKFLATAQYGMHRDIAVIMQGQLAEIGIQLELELPDWATRVAMGERGEADMALIGTGLETLDPGSMATFVDPSLPPSYVRSRGFEVPDLSDLLAKGRQELDLEASKAIYRQADQLMLDHTSFCGVAYRATGYARSKRVTDFALLPEQLSPFSAVNFDVLSMTDS